MASRSVAPRFLATPAEIRAAVGMLARQAPRMDLVVAFVGQDWRDAIAGFQGRLRVICWFTSTNTNPTAVRASKAEVRWRCAMPH